MLPDKLKEEIWLFTSILAAAQTLFLQKLSNGQQLRIIQKILNRITLEHRLTIRQRSEANNIIKNAIEDYNSKVPTVFQHEIITSTINIFKEQKENIYIENIFKEERKTASRIKKTTLEKIEVFETSIKKTSLNEKTYESITMVLTT